MKIHSWLLPETDDILGLLRQQFSAVTQSLAAIVQWSDGATTTADVGDQLKRNSQAESDTRRALLLRVRASFTTPIDAEDIFELSERVSALQAAMNLLIREADALQISPDAGVASMIAVVARAAPHLTDALNALPSPVAADHADACTDCLERSEHAYATASRSLIGADLLTEIRRRELYRRAEHITGTMLRLAHRTWYAVCKAS